MTFSRTPTSRPAKGNGAERDWCRPARRNSGETINTLEGPTTAAEGDWIVRGVDGEQWPVPGDEFARRYTQADTAVIDGHNG